MKSEGLFSCLQKPTPGLCLEQDESNARPCTLFY